MLRSIRVPAFLVLFFIAMCSMQIARIIGSFVGSWLEPSPALRDWTLPAVPPPPIPNLDARAVARAFGIAPHAEVEPSPPAEPPVVTSDNHWRLLATMVSTRVEYSSALLIDATQGAVLIRVGDSLGHLLIQELSREPFQVIVWNDVTHRREIIQGGDLTTSLPPAMPPRFTGIQQVDGTHLIVKRTLVDQTLGDLAALSTDVRILPVRKEGHAAGWQIASVRPDSILSAIGLKAGDTLLRVNGFDLSTPESALEAFQRVRNAAVLDVDLERGGTSMRMNYRVGE